MAISSTNIQVSLRYITLNRYYLCNFVLQRFSIDTNLATFLDICVAFFWPSLDGGVHWNCQKCWLLLQKSIVDVKLVNFSLI